ncbi:MAG: DEAD/DEAH box helicase [Patescibacteria group bacterium]|jgi:ATP-dependent RNA helicase RhlE
MTKQTQSNLSFADLGLSDKLLAILKQNNFNIPSPIQHQAIPAALEGKDLIGIAQTGTGKTLAFGLPMIQRIAQNNGQGLILLPTRELAIQVDENLQKIGRSLGLKTAVLIGGASMGKQISDLRRDPHIIIATPGRLVDHLQQRIVNLNKITVMVLDEADRMLDIGFLPQIKQILALAPKKKQLLMFSATMPNEVARLASEHMHLPLRIEVAPSGTAANNIEQEIFMISKEVRMQLLEKLLADYPGTILVFSRTKHGAKKIAAGVRQMGHSATEIHSNRSLAQRKDAMSGFKSGKYRVMIATDIAARGIDVNNISLIINYDLPSNSEDYVHRIGRTARAGKSGKAISFATPSERGEIKSIERLIRKTIPIMILPVLPPRRSLPPGNYHNLNNGNNRFQGGRNRGFQKRFR